MRVRTSTPYFTSEVDDAIAIYLTETDDEKRNRLYEDKIYPAFYKLAENVLNTYKFRYFEVDPRDMMLDVVEHLTRQLTKFNPERNSKKHSGKKTSAFSYFSTIAKNYLIYTNNETYKKWKKSTSIDVNCQLLRDEIEYEVSIGKGEPDYVDDEVLTIKQLDEFYDFYEWSKGVKMLERERKLIDRLRDLIEGKQAWLKGSNRTIHPLLWESVSDGISHKNTSMPTLKRLIKRFRKIRRGEKDKIPLFRIISEMPYNKKATPSRIGRYHRICPMCKSRIEYRGPGAKYNVVYAEAHAKVCQKCVSVKRTETLRLKRKAQQAAVSVVPQSSYHPQGIVIPVPLEVET